MAPIDLPEHLWRALAAMSADTGVAPPDLVRQAVFAWLRINGYVLPSAVTGAAEPVQEPALARQAAVEAVVEQLPRPRAAWPAEPPGPTPLPQEPPPPEPALPGADAPSDELPEPPEPATGVGHRAPVVDTPQFEPGTALLAGQPLILSIEREGQAPVRVDADRFVLGRGPQCDLIIDSPRVSREHAALVRVGMSWFIEDLGSSNGTFVADERVVRQELQSGDVVRLGNEVLLVVIRAVEPSLA